MPFYEKKCPKSVDDGIARLPKPRILDSIVMASLATIRGHPYTAPNVPIVHMAAFSVTMRGRSMCSNPLIVES